MAIGRIINSKITKDRDVAEFSDDTSRLAFTWLITFADRDGRTYGDPAIIRAMIFPRREDISIDDMADYIYEWSEFGKIIWYEVDDEQFICFPNFEKNQPNLRKDRETPSVIPAPDKGKPVEYTPASIRQPAVTPPTNFPVKLIKAKSSEVKSSELPAKKPAGYLFQIARALATVTGLDYEKNKGRLYRTAKKFQQGEEQQILREYRVGGIWYQSDWRGKKDQKPTPEQVVETWNNLGGIQPAAVSIPKRTVNGREETLPPGYTSFAQLDAMRADVARQQAQKVAA